MALRTATQDENVRIEDAAAAKSWIMRHPDGG
jgi:hypothetical protein